MFGILATIGTVMVFAVGAGLVIGVVIVVPTLLFTLPYAAWLGWNCGTKGIPKNAGNGKLFKNAHNAAKFYRSKIKHTPLDITDW